jgi:hypothetical protein
MATVVIVLFAFLYNVPSTLLAVSQCYIDAQGQATPPGGQEFKGGYWILLLTADMNDQISAVRLYNNEKTPDKTVAESSDGQKVTANDNVGTQEVVPQSVITISIDPGQPYYARQMSIENSIEVAPKAYQCYLGPIWDLLGKDKGVRDAEPLYSGHYEFPADTRWEKYTPFDVIVQKNGVEVGRVTMNTEGAKYAIEIQTGEGSILVKDIGKLSGIYGEPQIGDVMWFSDDVIYKGDSFIRALITNPFPTGGEGDDTGTIPLSTFAAYWYGRMYWKDDGTPAPYQLGIWPPVSMLDPSKIGGWYDPGSDWLYTRRAPYQPGIFESPKSGFKSVVEWLDSQDGVQRIYFDQYEKAFKRDDNKFQLNVPFSAINEGAEVFQIWIPTDLADTIVYEPPISNVKIIRPIGFPTELQTIATGKIVLSQAGNVKGTSTVRIIKEPSTAPLAISPPGFSTILEAGETKEFPLTFINTGGTTDVSCKVTFIVEDAFSGKESDRETITILVKKRTGEVAYLTIITKNEDGEAISGIYVTGAYGTRKVEGYTDPGGAKTWEMGAVVGEKVMCRAAESVHYYSAEKEIILAAGQNNVEFILQTKTGPPQGTQDWTWLLWVALVGTVIGATTIVVVKKRKVFEK